MGLSYLFFSLCSSSFSFLPSPLSSFLLIPFFLSFLRSLTHFLLSIQILLTEPPMNPKKNRERMVQEMFETYGFAGVYIAVQAVLTLYAQGALATLGYDRGGREEEEEEEEEERNE